MKLILVVLIVFLPLCACEIAKKTDQAYPAVWFAPMNDPNKPDWEILPQEAKPGEVILSKRNELGLLSNFAPSSLFTTTIIKFPSYGFSLPKYTI